MKKCDFNTLVFLFRLISERTVEENILKKANQKRMLGDMAIEGGNFTTAFFKQVGIYIWCTMHKLIIYFTNSRVNHPFIIIIFFNPNTPSHYFYYQLHRFHLTVQRINLNSVKPSHFFLIACFLWPLPHISGS